MNQIAAALEYYWHLRAQGFPDARARDHVRARFGVEIALTEVENAAEDCIVVEREPSTDFGTEFCTTIKGTSTGPAYG